MWPKEKIRQLFSLYAGINFLQRKDTAVKVPEDKL